MDKNLIATELINIRDICKSAETLDMAMSQTNLLIFPENGYSILSYEFAEYLSNKYSQEFPLDELHSLLPDIVSKLGFQIEPMSQINTCAFHCYKIYLK